MKLLFFPDRQIPMYLFILGTFTTGLGFGIATALIVFVKAKVVGMKTNKKIRELETALVEARKIQYPAPAAGQSPGTAGD